MKAWHGLLGWMIFAAGVGAVCAQTPVLSNIEAPYPNLQGTVTIASTQWGPGTVAYGPVGTPLVLNGSDLGASGIVQFIAYKNGTVDSNVSPVQAAVTLWSPTMLILAVPSGAYSGLVKVTTGEGKTGNQLPFMVTPGTYAGTCPTHPGTNQLQITTTSLQDATVGQSYSLTLGATGGTTAYSWSITSGTRPSWLSLNASTGVISGTPSAASGPVDLTFQVTDSSSPSQHDEVVLSLTVESQLITSSNPTVYDFCVPGSWNSNTNPSCGTSPNGYDSVGNLTSYSDTAYSSNGSSVVDSVMGSASFTYDTLNRVSSSNITWPDSTQQIACFTYDAFGNRTMEALSATACNANPTPTAWAQFNGTTNGTNNNQMSATSQNPLQGAPGGYDQSGDITYDGINQYVYDAEGRICAVLNTAVPGNPIMTGYLYDADGTRVAKGTITTMSCDPTTSGFQFTENYVLGPGGEELTMMSGSNAWQRTNVYAGGKLLATYDTNGLHFHLEDALGTRRMQLSGELADLGQPETDIQSLPFGDQLNTFRDQYAPATADDATPLHFTGKERDTESGNDYFKYRYYASSMGRWMSPDPSGLTHANLGNPQSLNLYNYVGNNPLTRTDLDGLCWKGFSWACSAGQVISNGLTGYGWHTDATVERNVHNAFQYLHQHGFKTEGMSGAVALLSYQTYKKLGLEGTVYSGRTSGTGTPEENVQLRDRNHHMSEKGFGEAQLDKSSTNPDAIRGREQQLIEANGGAKSQGGTSGNSINGISDSNPNREQYMSAAEEEFGPVEEAGTGVAEGAAEETGAGVVDGLVDGAVDILSSFIPW